MKNNSLKQILIFIFIYIGFPIVPGFDLSGRVLWAGANTTFKEGDVVFGFSLFGSYSRRVLVPGRQLRLAPRQQNIPGAPAFDLALLAGVPAVAATALHAVALARGTSKKEEFLFLLINIVIDLFYDIV
jgi:NADPH:quinone reductase-like Zn-dependent oxidoreductase